jgi:hypothetical protein
MTITATEACPQALDPQSARVAAIVFHSRESDGITPPWLRSLGGTVYPQIADAIESLDAEGLALSAAIAERAAA